MKRLISRRLFIMSLTFALAIALTGCSGDKAGDDSTITVGIPQDLDESLDPHNATGAGTREVLFNVFEGLVKPNSDGELIPAVASEYAVDNEGRTYTFTLRDGVTFHDGSPVTVEDVIASVEHCAESRSGELMVAAFSNIASIEATDEKTVEIKLSEPDTDFMTNMTMAIIPKSHVEDIGTNPIGTGPYKYVSRSPQENVVLEKYDGYWGEPAYLKNVIFKIVANTDTIVMNLEGGVVDIFPRITTAQAASLSNEFNIEEGTMNLVQALYLNNAIKPFDDVRVRQAMCYAINPQEIMDFVSDGKGTEIGSSMFPAFGKYFMPELNDTYNQDIDKAKKLLAEAGYENGFSFTITVPSNYVQHIDTAQVLKEELKAINIDANINLVEWNTWLSEVYSGRNFEGTVIGVDASTLSPRALLSRFESNADNNFINFSNVEYDKAYNNAISCADDDKQTQYYKECESILANEAANVYIQDMPELVAINKKYTGYEFYPLYAQDMSKIRPVE
ncbi:MAG: ABC transporter substrate-binding protein [Lachnospiraceae bacterium]|nr:ABC transporter substrate-binding protein [Candidatus Colinaster equi]